MSITMSARQLRAALDVVNPAGPEDQEQMDSQVTIWERQTRTTSPDGEPLPPGLYCHLTEHPEEGCYQLLDVPSEIERIPVPPGTTWKQDSVDGIERWAHGDWTIDAMGHRWQLWYAGEIVSTEDYLHDAMEVAER